MMTKMEVPPIANDIFDRIEDEKEFSIFVCKEYAYEASFAALKPKFSDDLMHDAHQSYKWDVERLNGNMKSSLPDHFKRCGLLAYWLRRHSPIALWEKTKKEYQISDEEKRYRVLISDLGRAYQAFSLGYRICYFFEKDRESGVQLPRDLDADYLRSVSYYMKYKSVSPHAMGLIYRSLFWV